MSDQSKTWTEAADFLEGLGLAWNDYNINGHLLPDGVTLVRIAEKLRRQRDMELLDAFGDIPPGEES